MPVGISFYTFQTLSYTIDVFRDRIRPTRNLVDFALYVCFFPQLVAGPIERASHLLPEIQNPRSVSWDDLSKGCWLLLLGYFQKSFVADNLAVFVDLIFSKSTVESGLLVWLAGLVFAFQIYGDFAGYSNIARGVARLLGFELMKNFDSPYFAIGPSDFWRRWHISLSTWLRDYLYIPLGGNRSGKYKTYRNLLLTMLLGGLWHGAAWNFVLWGMFHGSLLCAEKSLLGLWKRDPLSLSRSVRFCFWMFHVPLMIVGWIIFRAENHEQRFSFLNLMMTDFRVIGGIGLGYASKMLRYVWLLVVLDYLSWWKDDEFYVLRLPAWCKFFLYLLMVYSIIIMGQFSADEFIYFQF